jgi:dTDP-4-dehydrorhamnose 3,5-epimerase
MHTYADDRGFSIMSLFDHVGELPGQFNASTMYPGAVKAWHRHALQEDYWTVLAGALKIGLFNSETQPLVAELRLARPIPGQDETSKVEIPPQSGRAVYLGEQRPGVLRIPSRLWHGGVAVGGANALLLYYVTRKYDAQNPDEERADWNRFPFNWGTEFR